MWTAQSMALRRPEWRRGRARRPSVFLSLYVDNTEQPLDHSCQSEAMTSMTLNGADKEREHPPASLRVLRFVVGLLLFLVAPAWCGIAYWANTHAVRKHSDSVTPVVEIYDETGTIRDIGGRPLSAVLEDVRFSRAVHLVVPVVQ